MKEEFILLTILVDMDNVLENLTEVWIAHLNKRYNKDVKFQNLKDQDMQIVYPDLSQEQIFEMLNDVNLWKDVKPLPDAVKYLQQLVIDGHKVVIVTSGYFESVALKIRTVLFKFFPFLDWKDIVVAYQKNLVHGDIIIDDDIHNLKTHPCRYRLLFDAPWNHNWDNLSNNVIRVQNWEDIYFCISTVGWKSKEESLITNSNQDTSIDSMKICKTCKWHDDFSWACCNGESPHRADFVDGRCTCGFWESTLPVATGDSTVHVFHSAEYRITEEGNLVSSEAHFE